MQDEQHYPARVTALGPNTAVVMFTEFNNYEEVSCIHIVQTNFYQTFYSGVAGRLAAEALLGSCQI